MAELTERQRYVLELLNGHDWGGATSSQVGRRVQDRFGVPHGHSANSRRFGSGLAGLNVLKSLKRRGLVTSGFGLHAPTAELWSITTAGRQALHG